MSDLRREPQPPTAARMPSPLTLAAARLALGWERLWRASWRAACVAGAFAAVALLDVLPALPGWLHAATLLATAAALAVAARRGFRGFRWPTETEALRRLERDNGLAHRPLLTLRDRPAAGTDDPAVDVLWRVHCRTLARGIRRLRVPPPRPGVAARDPLGLRVLVALLLAAAAAGSWGDWPPRLMAALLPSLDGHGGGVPAALDVWVAPPDYTGAAPIFLRRAGADTAAAGPDTPVAVPAGSAVLARVSGGSGVPTLTVNGAEVPFSAIDDGHFQARETVRGGTEIAVRQGGRSLGRWPVAVVPDQPPAVAFTAPPAPTERGALRLDYQASDDYGVAAVAATVRLDPKAATTAGADGAPLVLPLPLPGLNQKSVRGAGFHDLTASPWAGLPALIRLTATDTGGRTGVSDEVPVRVPERVFVNPIAREIAAQRKALIARGEGARMAVARVLSELSARPAAFHDDAVVFLALRVAMARLLLDSDAGSTGGVRDLLWETALRLEDGGLSLAERDLRDAERALSEALDANASDDEVRRRMDDLQAALDRFLESMARQAAGTAGQNRPPSDANGPALDREDLDAMMRAMRDMAETGGRDGARRMLSDLRQLLENLRGGGDPGGLDQTRDAELLRELQDVTAGQRDLLDHSYREPPAPRPDRPQGQDATPPALPLPFGLPALPSPFGQPTPGTGPGPAPGGPAAAIDDQSKLRERLGTLMQGLGEANGDIPRPLGQAERAMRDAERALRLGAPGAAVLAQTQAVEELQQGARALSRMMAARMTGGGRDPLGRRMPGKGSLDSADVHVPEQRETQRAREILDELRRRAGQRERPRQELDYIERLLRQF